MRDNRQRNKNGAALVLLIGLWSALAEGRTIGSPMDRATEGFPPLTSASAHGAAVQGPEVR
jgi:hypothetical protein